MEPEKIAPAVLLVAMRDSPVTADSAKWTSALSKCRVSAGSMSYWSSRLVALAGLRPSFEELSRFSTSATAWVFKSPSRSAHRLH
jgi:hypothetical protein